MEVSPASLVEAQDSSLVFWYTVLPAPRHAKQHANSFERWRRREGRRDVAGRDRRSPLRLLRNNPAAGLHSILVP
eukprot:8420640-Heterocapsa_arctica.AAC.1